MDHSICTDNSAFCAALGEETEMVDETRPKIIIPALKNTSKQGRSPPVRARPLRNTIEQLKLIADTVAADEEVMAHLHRADGAESDELSRRAITRVTNRAQAIDPTISAAEGMRIFGILAIRLNKREGTAE